MKTVLDLRSFKIIHSQESEIHPVRTLTLGFAAPRSASANRRLQITDLDWRNRFPDNNKKIRTMLLLNRLVQQRRRKAAAGSPPDPGGMRWKHAVDPGWIPNDPELWRESLLKPPLNWWSRVSCPSPGGSRVSSEAVARRDAPKSRSGPCAPSSDWLPPRGLRPIGGEAVRERGGNWG